MLIGLGIEVDLRLPINKLIAAHGVALGLQLAIAGVEHQESRLLLCEPQAIDRTLLRGCEVYLDLRVVKIHLIAIRAQLLLIVAESDNGSQPRLVALVGREVEGRTLAMVGHDDWQTIQTVAREVGTLGIDAQQAVGQLHRRERGHKQVADVAHIGVHVVHRLLGGVANASSSRTGGGPAEQGRQQCE